MALLRNAALTSLLVVLLAFYVRPRFPETASNRGTKTAVGLFFKFQDLVAYLGELIGLDPVQTANSFYNIILLLDQPAADVKEETITIEGVEVSVFRPTEESDSPRPGIIHIHGGGFCSLSPAHYANYIREMVRKTNAVVLSINYRLAPKFKFPIPFEDCLMVTRHILNNPEKYGIHQEKIGLKGDSAGGNLVAAVSLNISLDSNYPERAIKFMSLDYPSLQAVDLRLPSFRKYENGPCFLNKPRMLKYMLRYAFGDLRFYEFFNNNEQYSYLDEKLREHVASSLLTTNDEDAESDTPLSGKASVNADEVKEILSVITHPMFSPLIAPDEDLAALPPAYIMNCEFDVLRDDGFLLAERLRLVGVTVEHSYVPSEEHGFIMMVKTEESAMVELNKFTQFFQKILGLNIL
ncbi:arylacetamide deacetylase-like [Dreissena polymorpha]|uniref:Alpha/beta hydrolase fold-3 domain-containing protein n=1 Tax=Dreissena polymorpha TaxID=45954 RepID=A0A9D4CSK4_DREPO|nr:arylacetamide deacetylase-like [Dreissena polymorpha]KAH3730004.1 hypothetical protein DPMN_055983 [Dreissena polymorpha]